ncbi:hypothetical protein F4780DRAFT_161395 [Xylariomycetidae sp. FL0641]|nr:hypothetical protein F4780DRAFT_161395 [Xylariomycetidae sp. FL0641]
MAATCFFCLVRLCGHGLPGPVLPRSLVQASPHREALLGRDPGGQAMGSKYCSRLVRPPRSPNGLDSCVCGIEGSGYARFPPPYLACTPGMQACLCSSRRTHTDATDEPSNQLIHVDDPGKRKPVKVLTSIAQVPRLSDCRIVRLSHTFFSLPLTLALHLALSGISNGESVV